MPLNDLFSPKRAKEKALKVAEFMSRFSTPAPVGQQPRKNQGVPQPPGGVNNVPRKPVKKETTEEKVARMMAGMQAGAGAGVNTGDPFAGAKSPSSQNPFAGAEAGIGGIQRGPNLLAGSTRDFPSPFGQTSAPIRPGYQPELPPLVGKTRTQMETDAYLNPRTQNPFAAGAPRPNDDLGAIMYEIDKANPTMSPEARMEVKTKLIARMNELNGVEGMFSEVTGGVRRALGLRDDAFGVNAPGSNKMTGKVSQKDLENIGVAGVDPMNINQPDAKRSYEEATQEYNDPKQSGFTNSRQKIAALLQKLSIARHLGDIESTVIQSASTKDDPVSRVIASPPGQIAAAVGDYFLNMTDPMALAGLIAGAPDVANTIRKEGLGGLVQPGREGAGIFDPVSSLTGIVGAAHGRVKKMRSKAKGNGSVDAPAPKTFDEKVVGPDVMKARLNNDLSRERGVQEAKYQTAGDETVVGPEATKAKLNADLEAERAAQKAKVKVSSAKKGKKVAAEPTAPEPTPVAEAPKAPEPVVETKAPEPAKKVRDDIHAEDSDGDPVIYRDAGDGYATVEYSDGSTGKVQWANVDKFIKTGSVKVKATQAPIKKVAKPKAAPEVKAEVQAEVQKVAEGADPEVQKTVDHPEVDDLYDQMDRVIEDIEKANRDSGTDPKTKAELLKKREELSRKIQGIVGLGLVGATAYSAIAGDDEDKKQASIYSPMVGAALALSVAKKLKARGYNFNKLGDVIREATRTNEDLASFGTEKFGTQDLRPGLIAKYVAALMRKDGFSPETIMSHVSKLIENSDEAADTIFKNTGERRAVEEIQPELRDRKVSTADLDKNAVGDAAVGMETKESKAARPVMDKLKEAYDKIVLDTSKDDNDMDMAIKLASHVNEKAGEGRKSKWKAWDAAKGGAQGADSRKMPYNINKAHEAIVEIVRDPKASSLTREEVNVYLDKHSSLLKKLGLNPTELKKGITPNKPFDTGTEKPVDIDTFMASVRKNEQPSVDWKPTKALVAELTDHLQTEWLAFKKKWMSGDGWKKTTPVHVRGGANAGERSYTHPETVRDAVANALDSGDPHDIYNAMQMLERQNGRVKGGKEKLGPGEKDLVNIADEGISNALTDAPLTKEGNKIANVSGEVASNVRKAIDKRRTNTLDEAESGAKKMKLGEAMATSMPRSDTRSLRTEVGNTKSNAKGSLGDSLVLRDPKNKKIKVPLFIDNVKSGRFMAREAKTPRTESRQGQAIRETLNRAFARIQTPETSRIGRGERVEQGLSFKALQELKREFNAGHVSIRDAAAHTATLKLLNEIIADNPDIKTMRQALDAINKADDASLNAISKRFNAIYGGEGAGEHGRWAGAAESRMLTPAEDLVPEIQETAEVSKGKKKGPNKAATTLGLLAATSILANQAYGEGEGEEKDGRGGLLTTAGVMVGAGILAHYASKNANIERRPSLSKTVAHAATVGSAVLGANALRAMMDGDDDAAMDVGVAFTAGLMAAGISKTLRSTTKDKTMANLKSATEKRGGKGISGMVGTVRELNKINKKLHMSPAAYFSPVTNVLKGLFKDDPDFAKKVEDAGRNQNTEFTTRARALSGAMKWAQKMVSPEEWLKVIGDSSEPEGYKDTFMYRRSHGLPLANKAEVFLDKKLTEIYTELGKYQWDAGDGVVSISGAFDNKRAIGHKARYVDEAGNIVDGKIDGFDPNTGEVIIDGVTLDWDPKGVKFIRESVVDPNTYMSRRMHSDWVTTMELAKSFDLQHIIDVSRGKATDAKMSKEKARAIFYSIKDYVRKGKAANANSAWKLIKEWSNREQDMVLDFIGSALNTERTHRDFEAPEFIFDYSLKSLEDHIRNATVSAEMKRQFGPQMKDYLDSLKHIPKEGHELVKDITKVILGQDVVAPHNKSIKRALNQVGGAISVWKLMLNVGSTISQVGVAGLNLANTGFRGSARGVADFAKGSYEVVHGIKLDLQAVASDPTLSKSMYLSAGWGHGPEAMKAMNDIKSSGNYGRNIEKAFDLNSGKSAMDAALLLGLTTADSASRGASMYAARSVAAETLANLGVSKTVGERIRTKDFSSDWHKEYFFKENLGMTDDMIAEIKNTAPDKRWDLYGEDITRRAFKYASDLNGNPERGNMMLAYHKSPMAGFLTKLQTFNIVATKIFGDQLKRIGNATEYGARNIKTAEGKHVLAQAVYDAAFTAASLYGAGWAVEEMREKILHSLGLRDLTKKEATTIVVGFMRRVMATGAMGIFSMGPEMAGMAESKQDSLRGFAMPVTLQTMMKIKNDLSKWNVLGVADTMIGKSSAVRMNANIKRKLDEAGKTRDPRSSSGSYGGTKNTTGAVNVVPDITKGMLPK